MTELGPGMSDFHAEHWNVDWPDELGDWGGHMQKGFDLDTEMAPIEIGERADDGLFYEWAAGIYSTLDDRAKGMELLLLRRIQTRDEAAARAYINHKYPEGQA